MSTITIQRQPEPSEMLVKSTPVKKGKTLQTIQNSEFKWKDLDGLTCILFDNGDGY